MYLKNYNKNIKKLANPLSRNSNYDLISIIEKKKSNIN